MTIAERAARPARSDSIFFPTMAAAMALVAFLGFSPTFYLQGYFDGPALTPLRIVHGAAFTAWLVLLIVQTGMIAANRRDIHRRLGVVGVALAASMIGLGTTLAISALREGHAPAGAPSASAFFAIPIVTMVVFLVLVAVGVGNRTRSGYHKRFMILATAAILPAAIARFSVPFIANGGPPVFFGLADLFIVACAVYDLSTRRQVHPATLWSGGIILVSQVLSLAIGGTAIWTSLTTWIVS